MGSTSWDEARTINLIDSGRVVVGGNVGGSAYFGDGVNDTTVSGGGQFLAFFDTSGALLK
jgi:hypothetical protein